MKKLLILGSLALIGASFTSCDDFLDDNRNPKSSQVVNETFWSNATNVENQINYFYESFTGYGNGTSTGDFYFTTMSDDQSGQYGGTFRDWKYTSVPTSSSAWSSPYTEIRRANQIIEGVASSSLKETEKTNFTAIARLYRGWQYYLLVRAYGDVPLVEGVLDVSDKDQIYGPRVDRNTVIDYALDDINYGVANINTQSSKTTFSKDLANAIKTEVCLFEGAYCKYAKDETSRSNQYYQEAVTACEAIMAQGYELGDYAALYQTNNGGLASNSEIIFCKCYQKGVFCHSTIDWTSGSTIVAGISKDAFDSFLFIDGKPKASTAEDTDDAAKMEIVDGDTLLSLASQLAVRDKRLSETIYDHVMYQNFRYQTGNTSMMGSTSGYGVKKYNDGHSHTESEATTANQNFNDAPLYWLAETYLAYAEAKAELGTLTDADLDKTINKLYTRAGLPTQTVAGLEAINDPANNMGVTSLIWEIRRCRRCELMMDNDIRYWDLVRWNALNVLDTNIYPNTIYGANLNNQDLERYPYAVAEIDGGKYLDSRKQLYGSLNRTWNSKHSLYPIPSGQITLYKSEGYDIAQNPGW